MAPLNVGFLTFNSSRLNDLCETVSAERHSVRFSEEKSYGGRGGKKGDVLQFVSLKSIAKLHLNMTSILIN